MRVLVVGSGAREHALAWRLARSPSVTRVLAAPGNPGIASVATLFPVAADDVAGQVALARREAVDLVVVGPEAALAAGLADALDSTGIACFGPSMAAAEIETSKAFAKSVMARAGVPTAAWGDFTDGDAAAAFVRARGGRLVVKADGLAAGKGVVVCDGPDEAERTARAMLAGAVVGGAGARVLVEELLVGREASCLAFVDGERVAMLPACEDHKTVLDGDRGPMTGGMGVVSPTPVVDDAMLARVEREVIAPTARALARMGRPFRGVLFAGLMVCSDGPRVLEFNCRFGDPETEALAMRLGGDLGVLLAAVATGRELPAVTVAAPAACTVVMAARGYPGAVEKGAVIDGIAEAERDPDVVVFHAGTRLDGGRLVASGGRVLAVTARGATVDDARARAYHAVDQIRFDGAHCRRDIGARAHLV